MAVPPNLRMTNAKACDNCSAFKPSGIKPRCTRFDVEVKATQVCDAWTDANK